MTNEVKTICNLIQKYVGSISAIAETGHDRKVIKNLDTLFEIVSVLIDDIQLSMTDAHGLIVYGSAENVFVKERDYLTGLKENIEEWLKEVEE